MPNTNEGTAARTFVQDRFSLRKAAGHDRRQSWHRPTSSTRANGRQMPGARRRCCSDSITGALHSPIPGAPPSPPVTVTGQFPQPFTSAAGTLPNAITPTRSSARSPPIRYRFSYYTLDAGDGALEPLGSTDAQQRETEALAPVSGRHRKLRRETGASLPGAVTLRLRSGWRERLY